MYFSTFLSFLYLPFPSIRENLLKYLKDWLKLNKLSFSTSLNTRSRSTNCILSTTLRYRHVCMHAHTLQSLSSAETSCMQNLLLSQCIYAHMPCSPQPPPIDPQELPMSTPKHSLPPYSTYAHYICVATATHNNIVHWYDPSTQRVHGHTPSCSSK